MWNCSFQKCVIFMCIKSETARSLIDECVRGDCHHFWTGYHLCKGSMIFAHFFTSRLHYPQNVLDKTLRSRLNRAYINEISPLQDPVIWYGINYAGTQAFSRQRKSGWTGTSNGQWVSYKALWVVLNRCNSVVPFTGSHPNPTTSVIFA